MNRIKTNKSFSWTTVVLWLVVLTIWGIWVIPHNTPSSTTTQQAQTSKPTTSSSLTGKQTQISQLTGTINEYGYVDLGLSVKWAISNVGTTDPSGYGDYFAWGETKAKSEYPERNSVTYRKEMGCIAGNPQYDAATANWGGTWRLPTKDEIDELVSKCTQEWTTLNNHKGYKVTGPNGNSIFLPAAGWRLGTSLNNAGERGHYWSATPLEDYTDDACNLYFGRSSFSRDWDNRDDGQSVRPVSE